MVSKCPILKDCEETIDVLVWHEAKRQGTNARGRQNSQLELGVKNMAVKDVVERLFECLEICRIHQSQYEWKNLIRKIDLTMSDPETTRVLCTDFAATLDLKASEKDNSSVDNHAVVCIFLVCHDWRKVKFKTEGENGEEVIDDETIVNDCDKWIFFAPTLSKGEKNDHITHHAALKYIVKHYDDKRIAAGLPPITNNIVHTDNCPTQYKCRQNFYKVSTFGSEHDHDCRLIHKLAQKFRFKGSWDATGKIVKERILNHELKYFRCATAFDCYIKLRDDLVDKARREKLFQKFDQYERDGDAKILKNTTYTSKNTYVGYATEDKDEYDTLMSAGHQHLLFTERAIIDPDMKRLNNTLKLSQVQGDATPNSTTGKWTVTSSFLSCACFPCRTDPSSSIQNCLYKHSRTMVQHDIQMKGEQELQVEDNDELGLNLMTVPLLRMELEGRGIRIPRSWKKCQLIEALTQAIEDAELNDDDLEEELTEEGNEEQEE